MIKCKKKNCTSPINVNCHVYMFFCCSVYVICIVVVHSPVRGEQFVKQGVVLRVAVALACFFGIVRPPLVYYDRTISHLLSLANQASGLVKLLVNSS